MQPERYPNTVVEILHGFAILAAVLGIATACVVLAGEGIDTDIRALRLLIAAGISLGTALLWATFKAAALIVAYLWTIQHHIAVKNATQPHPLPANTRA